MGIYGSMTTMIHTSEQLQPGRLRFAFPVALFLGVAVILLHALIVYVLPWPPATVSMVSDCLEFIYGFIAAGVLIYAAFVAKRVSHRVGIAWMLIGIAFAIYAIGDVIWGFIEVVMKTSIYPSLADAAYLAFYVYFIVGIFILPARMLKPNERLRLILDMGIVTVSSLMLFWTLMFNPIFNRSEPDGLSLFVSIAYPSMGMALLLGVIAIILSSGRLQSFHVLLGLSALTMVVADVIFNMQMVRGTYVSGSLADVMYVIRYVLAAWAGIKLIVVAHLWPNEIVNPFDDRPATNPIRQTARKVAFLVPYVWIGLAFCLLVYEHFVSLANPPQSTFNIVALGLATIIILVLVRQFVQLKETIRLSADLALLLESSRILASPFQLQDAPRIALKQLSIVLPFDKAAIALPKHDGTIQLTTATYADETLMVQPYRSLSSVHMLWRALEVQKVTTSESPPASVADAQEVVNVMLGGSAANPSMLSWMIAPLIVNDLTVGLVVVGCRRPLRYTSDHASLFVAWSRQAAAAIENARLRRHETQAAAASERSRLARELHDSVSQALYGVTLGIQTAQVILDGESPAREPLNYSLNLANGALAEMKALIFELRPETLATEGLVQALRKQTDALCKRHKIDARISAPDEEPVISFDAKEAIYRIALEAVQNTIRHAQATRIDISVSQRNDKIVLEVRDNGRGFDPKATYTGHLGLISMRERADQLGGTFVVESELGRGTCIHVTVPMIESNSSDEIDTISLSSRR